MLPPFSVLDARQGYWQERKSLWISLGIRSALGRSVAGPKCTTGKNSVMGKMSGRLAVGGDQNDGETVISLFDPVLCESCIRWYSPPGGSVLDPFAGGSVRGIIAACLGRSYVGVDLSAEQVEENRRQARGFAALAAMAPPQWVVGDGRDIDSLLPHGDAFDMLLTCPPYYDLEQYSDDPRDLSNAESYAEFLSGYEDALLAALRRLRRDRFACLVVGDVRDGAGIYRGLPNDTARILTKAGLGYYNEEVLVTSVASLALRAGRMFRSTRKLGRAHQFVLVFVKGNPERAAAACGPAALISSIGEGEGDE